LIANTSGYGALCQQVNNPEKYGIFKTAETGNITQVIEKPQEYISNLASLFYLKVNSDLIDFCEDINVSPR
jgi:dTDP-glucose pyrophosphorylase